MQRSNSFANPGHRSSAFSTNTKRSKKVAQKLAALISKAAFFDTCPMIEPLISKKIHQSPAGSGQYTCTAYTMGWAFPTQDRLAGLDLWGWI